MLHLIARLTMIIAIWNLSLFSSIPANATNKQSAVNLRKVEACIKKVEQEARRIKRLPPIISETAKRYCWVVQDAKSAIPLLSSLNTRGLDFKKANDLIVQQGFDGKAQTKEPGILGLDGAREVLTESLASEVTHIWTQAEAAGGPAVSDSASRASAKKTRSGKTTHRKPTRKNKKTQKKQGVVAIDVIQETSDIVEEKPVIAVTNQQITGNSDKDKTYIQEYVDQHIAALENDPDSAILIKVRMYLALKNIVLKPVAQRTAHEKRYMAAFEKYVSRQYLVMVNAAINKYEEFNARSNRTSTTLGALFETGDVPPNYARQMGAGIALGASGAAVFAVIQGYPVATFLTVVKAGAGVSRVVNMSVAFSSGPAAIIATGVLVGVLQAERVGKKAKAEKDLRRLQAWAKSARVHLGQLVGSREGMVQFEYFFAKATSRQSPAGYVDPAETCRACFFAEQNFDGKMTCTNKPIRDLGKHIVDDDKLKMNNNISSVALVQNSCPNSFAVLYDKKGLSGDRMIIRSSIADLSAFDRNSGKSWDNAATSIAFSDDDAPKCEICTYSKAGYGGRKFCTSDSVSHLSSVRMAEKIASVKMNVADCPAARAWLYQKPEFSLKKNGTGIKELTGDIRDLGKSFNNTASSLFFSAEGVNPHEEKATGGCRACLYDLEGHKGEYMCVNSNIPDMSQFSIGSENYNLANKASSVQFLTDTCKKDDALELEMFTKANFGGEVYRIFGTDFPALSGNANNNIASVKLSRQNTSKSCRVCFYKNQNFQGQKQCITEDTGTFASGMNNSFSSVRFENNACKGAAIILNDAKGFGGKSVEVTRSYGNLRDLPRGGGTWNNAASSARFHEDYAVVQAKAKELQQQMAKQLKKQNKPAAKDSCQVCVYQDRNYRGASSCYKEGSKIPSLSLNNKVSSIKVERNACPQGGAIIYRDKSYRGKSAFVLGNVPDTRNLPGSSVTWNNNISSLKFSGSTRTDVFNASKAGFPGMSDKQITNRINSVFGE